MILIVDDDQSVLAIMQRRLEQEGYRTAAATNGAEAIAWLASHRADLILLDLNLPDMTRDELLRNLVARSSDVPVVAVTGHGDERVAVEVMKSGVRDYLMKDGAFWELLPSVARRVIAEADHERRLAATEASLRESQRMLATLMSNLPGMAYRRRHDVDGTMEFVSEGCRSLTGYEATELATPGTVSYAGLIHPDDRAAVFSAVQAAVRERRAYQVVYRITAANGMEKWVWEQGRGVYGSGGEVIALEGFIADMTDRKTTEVELTRYRDHLEELVEQRTRELEESREQLRLSERLASLGTLAAGVAHEINNPVGMILLAAQNALNAKDSPDAHLMTERCLREIETQSHRCARIVKSLLQFARQEPSDKWPDDLNRIVARAVELTRHYAEERRAVIDLRCAPALPLTRLNPLEMEQAFANLLRNAVEAGDEGVRVLVRTEQSAQTVRVLVQDNGRGMTHEQIKRAFDPFFTTRRNQGGTGLGMSIVHGIITAHGGTIAVESEPGYGTLITIDLPWQPSVTKEPEYAPGVGG